MTTTRAANPDQTSSTDPARRDVTAPRASRAERADADWLTAALRPAGTIGRSTAARLGRSLAVLAGAADMVVLDLSAASVAEPSLLAQALRAPGQTLSGHHRCLLVVGGGDALTAELDRHNVSAASCAAIPDNVLSDGAVLSDGVSMNGVGVTAPMLALTS